MSMYGYTTPTVVLEVAGADLTGMEVFVTFERHGRVAATVRDPQVAYDAETGASTLVVGLGQATSGALTGRVLVQVNAVDERGYRFCTDTAALEIGRNMMREVVEHG